MLSDTLFDTSQSLQDRLDHYTENNETYDYPPALLAEVQQVIKTMQDIQFRLDTGQE